MPARNLVAHFTIPTPLFMTGSDPEGAELRVPSLKGGLRFWWRALALGRLKSVSAVWEAEKRLFGSTESQSRVLMRLRDVLEEGRLETNAPLKTQSGQLVGSGARYLGYGVIGAFGEKGGQVTRPCLQCVKGTLELTFKGSVKDDDIFSVRQALIAMGLLGGVGAKARKGYGSFSLQRLLQDGEQIWASPHDQTALVHAIKELWQESTPFQGRPPYSAFSTRTRIDLLDTQADPLELLNSIGKEIQIYRSWGNRNQVAGEAAEQNFKDDHDWSKNPGGTQWNHFIPKRTVFGLPHPYGKSAKVTAPSSGRRSSPLILHIHRLGSGDYSAVSTLLEADFLNEPIQVESRKLAAEVDYSVIHDLLDGRRKFDNQRLRFPHRETVIAF